MRTEQKGGSGRSRLEAYHCRSFSKKTILWPRACRARVRERKVVACPLPHAEVMERPKMTIFNFRSPDSRCHGAARFARDVLLLGDAQDSIHLSRTQGVGVIAKRARPHGIADLRALLSIQR